MIDGVVGVMVLWYIQVVTGQMNTSYVSLHLEGREERTSVVSLTADPLYMQGFRFEITEVTSK